ncbi:transcription elongation factor [Actinoplanes sp. LDG1-06]|uniref:Transcription elongation factor n=1 Tax=Paractinoplanes ovalisporus TaxID=2810368 RepID=A0ABS2APK2_9ACTN|nr:transcription elongation factor [Actinoplanes ovalisporus]MBM2621700.1 transcription elongation factor [Actinoplanes ovalisporus]
MESARGLVTSVSRNEVYSFTKPVHDEIVLVAGLGVEGDSHAGVHVRHQGRVRADPTQPNLRQVHLIHEELFTEVGAKGYEVRAGNLGENVTTRGIDLLGLPVGTILRFGVRATGDSVPASSGHRLGAGDSAPASSGHQLGAGDSAPASSGHRLGAGDPGAASSGHALGAGDSVAGVRGGDGRLAGYDGASGSGVLDGVLAAATAATLDEPTARAAAAVRAAVAREAGAVEARGADPRPALVVAGLRNPCGQINGLRPGLLKEMVGYDEEGNLVRKGGIMTVVLHGGPVRPGDLITAEMPPPPYGPLERV